MSISSSATTFSSSSFSSFVSSWSSTSSIPSSSSSSSSSLPFTPCSVIDETCWSAYTDRLGYCCPNALCDPFQDCSFGGNDGGSNSNAAAISTTTLLFVLCVVLFFALLYRRWRLRRDFLTQLQYLSYLEASDEHERERRMAASALHNALEMGDVRQAENAAGEAEEQAPAAAAAGRGRGGFKAFTGRAFKLGELDEEEEEEEDAESTALHHSQQRSDDVDDSHHSIKVSSDADEDEKTS